MWARFVAVGFAGCVLGFASVAAAQSMGHHTKRAAAPRPSLEGIWTANFILTMEATAKTPTLTVPEAEQKAVAEAAGAEVSKVFEKTLDPEAPALIKTTDGLPLVRGQRRTRALVQPADGRLPLTPEARKELDAPSKPRSFDNPEQRSYAERCLLGLGLPPITDFIFENALQIVRAPGYVVLHTEYGDEVRIVPLTDVHGPSAIPSRLGDSIGHFEGETLVIETRGLPDAERVRGFPSYMVPAEATVIERLTPVSNHELLYQFTVVDPKTYTAPWLAEFSWFRTEKPMFEHACHEGNYSLPNILAGARHEEAVANSALASANR